MMYFFFFVCVEEYTLNIVDKIFGFPKMKVVLGIKLYLVCTLKRPNLKILQVLIYFNNTEKLKNLRENENFHLNLIFNEISQNLKSMKSIKITKNVKLFCS